MEEDEHVARRRRRAGVDGDRLVEAEHRAQPGEQLRLALGGESRRRRRAPARRPARARPCARAASSQRVRLRRPATARWPSMPGLELLQDARHGEEPRRLDRGQVGDDLARVRAASSPSCRTRSAGSGAPSRSAMCAAGSHEITREPSGKWMIPSAAVHAGQQVAVHELHALRRAGRARRVDQRDEVLGLDGAPVRLGVEAGVGALDVRPADACRRRAPPSTTITCSSAGSSARAARKRVEELPPRRSPRARPRRRRRRRSGPA